MSTRVLAALLALPLAASAGEGVVAYVGEARDRSGELLYEERHLLRLQDGQPAERLVMYHCPDGTAFARKHVRYADPPYRPEFSLYDARLGYREGFELDSVFVQRHPGADLRRTALAAADGLVVDAGFDEFVRSRWDALLAGEALRLDFVVPSRLAAYGFRVRRLREEMHGNDPVSVFQLSLAGLMGWFGDAIEVAYRHHDQRLMRFSGLTNIRALSGRNLAATIEFPPARESAAGDVDWQAAEREPLADCTLGS